MNYNFNSSGWSTTFPRGHVLLAMFIEWLNGEGYEVDCKLLRNLHPELMNFEDWVERQGKTLFQK